jgi:putative ABC transport system permease protein
MRLLRRFKYLLHRNRRERELAEELAFHRVLAEREQRESGLTPAEARRAASRQLGNTTLAREAAHYIWFPAAVEGLFQDLRYAWRGLSRNKALVAVSCLSLGLSTGFGTALISVVNSVLLQPVTAKRPASMVRLWVGDGNRISGQNLHDICEDTPGVACSGYRIEDLMLNQGGDPVRLFGQVVSPNYFSMLGIAVLRGRTFTSETVRETADTVVVTHAFWQRQLANDPNVIGRKLLLSGHPFTVIGVLPRGFRSIWGMGISPSLYLPIGAAVQPSTEKRSDTKYEILGMLAPEQSLAEFRSRVSARARALEQAYPLDNREFGRVQTFPVHRFGLFAGSDDSMMRVLLLFASSTVVFALLLAVVACVNVAGLLVARATARQREIAIRLSIGCGRMRLVRLLLAESFLLAIAGVGLGAALSVWLARLLVAVPLPFPVPFEVEAVVDAHLLVFLAALVGLVTVVVGVAPALQAWRVSVIGASGRAPAAAGFRRWSLRGGLITVQIAISTVLLVATTLFVRSLWVASQIDPGFDLDRVALVETDTRSRQLSDAETSAYYRAALSRLKSLPNVTAVSGANVVPLSMNSIVTSLMVDRGGKDQPVTVNNNWILPDYFRVMGIPLRAGREFGENDRLDKPRVAIVNETFARRLFPNRGAIGQRVRRPVKPDGNPEPWAEIVAVVADSRYLTLGEEARPLVYWPFGLGAGDLTIHVRTETDASELARALQDVLHGVNPRIAARVRPLRSVMSVALFPAQAAAVALAALGLVGWALTLAGLYGVVAYTVTRRIPEIGVRVALGAPPFSLMRLLLRDGLILTCAGLTAGLILAALVTPFLAMFLAGVPPHDLTSFAVVAAVLVVTALAASFGPARRGMRLSPADALRNE